MRRELKETWEERHEGRKDEKGNRKGNSEEQSNVEGGKCRHKSQEETKRIS